MVVTDITSSRSLNVHNAESAQHGKRTKKIKSRS
jgi:hypothetical protein